MKKMYAPEELKEKTIKDVNDAIESGEIETGGYLQPVIEDDKIVGYTLSIYNNSEETYEIVNLKFDEETELFTLDDEYGYGFNFIVLHTDTLYAKSFRLGSTSGGLREIFDSSGSVGNSGQVLKKTQTGIEWSDSPKLYSHELFIRTNTNNTLSIFIINSDNTPINSASLMYEKSNHQLTFYGRGRISDDFACCIASFWNYNSLNTLYVKYISLSSTGTTIGHVELTSLSITDTITEL